MSYLWFNKENSLFYFEKKSLTLINYGFQVKFSGYASPCLHAGSISCCVGHSPLFTMYFDKWICLNVKIIEKEQSLYYIVL